MEKAAELKESYEQARADFECLEEIRAVILSHLQAGSNIIHKVYGAGTIVSMEDRLFPFSSQHRQNPKNSCSYPRLAAAF